MRSPASQSLVALALATATLAACSNETAAPRLASPGTASRSTGLPGNPSTALYKFNMIGVSNPKQVDLTGDNGKRMFVNLNERWPEKTGQVG